MRLGGGFLFSEIRHDHMNLVVFARNRLEPSEDARTDSEPSELSGERNVPRVGVDFFNQLSQNSHLSRLPVIESIADHGHPNKREKEFAMRRCHCDIVLSRVEIKPPETALDEPGQMKLVNILILFHLSSVVLPIYLLRQGSNFYYSSFDNCNSALYIKYG